MAILAAIRRASSLLSNLAAEPRAAGTTVCGVSYQSKLVNHSPTVNATKTAKAMSANTLSV